MTPTSHVCGPSRAVRAALAALLACALALGGPGGLTSAHADSTALLDYERSVAQAAYGGVAAMLPSHAHVLAGADRADSLVVNPHKWLFTPFDLSAFYCRRMDVLRAAFSLVPEYLRTPEAAQVRNLMDTGIQLGRRFRALKLWMILRHFGAAGLRRVLTAHVALAREFADWIDAAPDFERLAPVPFSVVCFRARPASASMSAAELDALNARLLDAVNATGDVFLSHTRLNGAYVLRLAVGHVRTRERHVARAWELLLTPTRLPTAVRINLFSAFMSATAHGFWFLIADRVLAYYSTDRVFRLVGASVAVLVSATAFTVWNQSNVNEKVYTLSVLVVAAVSWLAMLWLDRKDEPGSGWLLVLALVVPALNLSFRFVVAERLGTIILSILVAHTAWHWMTERGAQLLEFPLPALDAVSLLWLVRAATVASAQIPNQVSHDGIWASADQVAAALEQAEESRDRRVA